MTDPHANKRRITTVLVVVLACLVPIQTGALCFLLLSEFQGRARDRDNSHANVQGNVSARYDDCTSGEQVRAALRVQVEDSARTDPLLYKLLPSLDTPEVHALVRERRAKQLKAYAPRDCRSYALAAVPARDRGSYHAP